MSVIVESITQAEARARFLANLEDADMTESEFIQLKSESCHLSCVKDWRDDRWIAIEAADTYFFLMGGGA